MQKIGGPLRVRCRGKDRAVVGLQHLEPVIEIASVVAARLGGQFEVGAKERRAKLGDERLHRVTLIAPPLAPEIAVKARGVFRPVAGFVPRTA